MPTDWSVQLKSIVLADNCNQREALAGELEKSPHLVCVDTPATVAGFRDLLSQQDYDIAVIALEDADDRMPACLLRYPDLQVLLVTPSRKAGSMDSWLQQGANDVVSRQRHENFRYALERMLEGCITRAQLRLATSRLATQDKLTRILLNTHAEAMLLWQDEQILESNGCLSALLGCHNSEDRAYANNWRDWLSEQSYAELHSPAQSTLGELVITSKFGLKYKASVERLVLDNAIAQLIRINPRPIDPATWQDQQNDSVTGVLRREHFLTTLDSWQRSSILSRYTVVQITIDEPDAVSGAGRANSTLQELLVYRVANLLQQTFQDDMLMGRTGPTALTIVSCTSVEDSRHLALQIRQCLGTVGGIVDDPNHIRVKTLTLSPLALTSAEVLQRLEQHPLMTRRVGNMRANRPAPLPPILSRLSA